MDGAIVGGNLEAAISQSEHLCTTREFSDFELLVEGRVEGDPNAGVGFRSQRLPGSNEVAGYQADMGFLSGRGMSVVSDVDDLDLDSSYPLWGSLLDEFRQHPGRYPDPATPYWLLAVADREVVDEALREDDWNELAVTA